MARTASAFDFNPHEREARDQITAVLCTIHYDFNPHEREARDRPPPAFAVVTMILIHTSVKLVTYLDAIYEQGFKILIHTSVKLVTVHKFYTLVSIYFSIQNANVVDLH